MTRAVAPAGGLTDEERAELAAYEHLVQDPKLARGLALGMIREKRLYRETYETFDRYCLERWKLSKTHVNRLIQGAAVLKNLTPIGVTDLRESHARALASLPPEEQRLVVRFVKDTGPGGRLTASHVKTLATVVQDVMRAGAIDDGTGIMVEWGGLSPERKRALLEANLTEEAYERQQRQQEHVNQILRSSNSNDWFTPAPVVDGVRRALGAIDLDPASCTQANRTVKATHFYDKERDGLKEAWKGRIFVNPPYGGLAGPFVEHLIGQYTCGNTTAAIALVNAAATHTNWFQPLFDYPLCFARRINFESPDGPTPGATHGSVLAYLGQDERRFVDVFREFGPVVKRVDDGEAREKPTPYANA